MLSQQARPAGPEEATPLEAFHELKGDPMWLERS